MKAMLLFIFLLPLVFLLGCLFLGAFISGFIRAKRGIPVPQAPPAVRGRWGIGFLFGGRH